MSIQIIPVEPFDLVIFGATGDLSMRKLLPGLFRRCQSGQLPENARIIGVARTNQDSDAFKGLAAEAIETFIPEGERDEASLNRFLERLHYITNDVFDPEGWQEIKQLLDECGDHVRVFYLAVAPSLFEVIAKGLHGVGLSDGEARLVVEKPIGRDQGSARALNQMLGQYFDESCVYRIDHYLGKETVQNLMALRFANALFEPIWNAQHIDHVQITVAETVSVGSRGGYYDGIGAMRDMVQNHLLQLLCLTAMEPPHDFFADAVRDEKLKVLQALEPIGQKQMNTHTVRGQYSGSGDQPSYAEESGNPGSKTECYVALKAHVNNWRWRGVPFYLRTGKCLSKRLAEISIHFKPVPHNVFHKTTPLGQPNCLVLRLQPDEGLELEIMTKEPGPGGLRLRQTPLDMSFAEGEGENWRMPDAYERLVMDVVRGNQTLFMRGDEVEAAWQWVDPILAAWADSTEPPASYQPGSSGPETAIALMARDNRTWRTLT